MANVALSQTPEPVTHADELIAALDRCLVSGFARLGKEHRQTLESLARVFTGTPLAGPVTAAVQALSRGEVTEGHLVAMACARESLSGARYDALAAQACAALGESVVLASTADRAKSAQSEPAAELPNDALTYMSSTRQWLIEVALTGLGQLEVATVVPFADTLEAIQAVPSLFGLATLLTGFLDELMDNLPTSTMTALPARRWSDLWTRALVRAWRPGPVHVADQVSGTLRLLGADIRHHDHMLSVAAYGLFDRPGAATVLVRTTVSGWKVDAVTGHEVWNALAAVPAGRDMLTALAEGKTLEVEGATLSSSGELTLVGSVETGTSFDPMAAATGALTPGARLAAPDQPPLARHPAHLAIPVAIDGAEYSNQGGAECVAVAGAAVPLAWSRVSPLAELDFAALRKCQQVFGLLRYDAGTWALQPLQARAGKKLAGPAAGMAKGLKLKKSATTLGVLQERASKLLRAK